MVEQSKASEIKLKGVKILQRAFLGWNHHFKNNYNIQILSETFGFIDGFYSIQDSDHTWTKILYHSAYFRNRKPSIDVSKHSKKRRLKSIWNYTLGLYDTVQPNSNFVTEKQRPSPTTISESVTSKIR